ncbi:MAG: hypothetical protein NUV81_00900, partial [bacterium]|nr:hypothetical protein [bacterium]
MSLLIATCGPTAIGKTTQMQHLIDTYPETFTVVLSVTTRPQRDADDDRWYRFISRSEADRMETTDIITKIEFRGEIYFILRSEMDLALQRKPIALMAILPDVILEMRKRWIPHSLVCCKIGDEDGYRSRL